MVVKKEGSPIKFIGFGPDSFSIGPLTYSQMSELLIKYYNQDHSLETKNKISEFRNKIKPKGSSSLDFSSDELELVKIQLAEMLKKMIKNHYLILLMV